MVDGNSATKELVYVRTGKDVPTLLRELYLERGRSDREIAEAIGVHRVTVTNWRREYGIRRADRPPLEVVA